MRHEATGLEVPGYLGGGLCFRGDEADIQD